MYWVAPVRNGLPARPGVQLVYAGIHTTKLRLASWYWPMILQQPGAGIWTSTSIDEPISGAKALVAADDVSDLAGPSMRTPLTDSFGEGSLRQSYPSRHQNTFWT